MRDDEHEKRVTLLEKWTPFFIIACVLLGALIGTLLIYLFDSEFPYEVIISAFIVAIVLTIIEGITRRKKSNIPIGDEQHIRKKFRNYVYGACLFIGILLIAVVVMAFL